MNDWNADEVKVDGVRGARSIENVLRGHGGAFELFIRGLPVSMGIGSCETYLMLEAERKLKCIMPATDRELVICS